jgi:hypothetical protein
MLLCTLVSAFFAHIFIIGIGVPHSVVVPVLFAAVVTIWWRQQSSSKACRSRRGSTLRSALWLPRTGHSLRNDTVARYPSLAMRRGCRHLKRRLPTYRSLPVRRPPTTERRSSFGPQRRDRVDVGGAIRRPEDRGHEDQREREQRAHPRPRIQRLYLIEL